MLLISPGIIKWTDADFGLPHLVSMGGLLQRELDLRVEILDLAYEGGDHLALERTMDELGPYLLIGVSCYSSFDYMRVMGLGRFIKDLYPEVPLVTGGYHASALPDDLVFDGSPFDAAVVGEGELPLLEMAQTALGGGELEQRYGPDPVEDLDWLPPYQWDLLARYWPRAGSLGRKLQLYLSRGCPHRCTFCMERAKGTDRWRALSPDRALDELHRLARRTDLSGWLVNIADPLFGLRRGWRREVLQRVADEGLAPRQFWTLTRADGLEEEDVRLLARARVSIGVGVESGSPRMLRLMRKTSQPEQYLESLQRLARWSNRHRLSWAANVVVGHPGETEQSMEQTLAFVSGLFDAAPRTSGWLSVDPFRLYPGSHVHVRMEDYSRQHGARFFHPRWWRRWYDTSFCAEHVDPSGELDFEGRVRFMHDRYAPLMARIAGAFRGQGRAIDRVFCRSIEEQVQLVGTRSRDNDLHRAAMVHGSPSLGDDTGPAATGLPMGLQVRDPQVRLREDAVRRLLQRGVLRTEALVEALLSVAPEQYLGEEEARAMLQEQLPPDGAPAAWVGITSLALALEALEPGPGDRLADLLAWRGYAAAIMARLVGPSGSVLAVCPGSRRDRKRLSRDLAGVGQARVESGQATTTAGLAGPLDGVWLGGALPRRPGELREHLADPGGRCVLGIGPRFRPQDLVCLTRQGDGLGENVLARVRLPVVAGPQGWTR